MIAVTKTLLTLDLIRRVTRVSAAAKHRLVDILIISRALYNNYNNKFVHGDVCAHLMYNNARALRTAFWTRPLQCNNAINTLRTADKSIHCGYLLLLSVCV